MKRQVALVISMLLGSAYFSFARTDEDVLPLRIRKIQIQTLGVFDPSHREFQPWVFRLLNRLHITTRRSLVRSELLLTEGDFVVRDLMRESERNLRRYTFLSEVSVRAVPTGRGQADLTVKTEDQWTTKPTLSFGKTRGSRKYEFGIDEENFLGLGKRVAIQYQHNPERTGIVSAYGDPRFLGSRLKLQLGLAENSDGYKNVVSLTQPFYTQQSDWSYGVHFDATKRLDHLYYRGIDAASLQMRQNWADLFFKRSWGDRYKRFRIGPNIGYEEVIYPGEPLITDEEAAERTEIERNLDPVERRIMRYGLNIEAETHDFFKFYYLDKFGRTEDLPRGILGGVRFGYAENRKGSDYVEGGIYMRWSGMPGQSQYLIADSDISSRRQDGGWNNVIAKFSSRFYLQSGAFAFPIIRPRSQTFAVRVSSVLTNRVDPPFQLTLGEEEGLRGYTFRRFTGLNRVLLNLEDRIYTRWDNRLFALALVPFADAGYVWGKTNSPHLGLGCGMGFRIALKKLGRTKIFRVDIAYPFTNADSKRISLSVSSGQMFEVL